MNGTSMSEGLPALVMYEAIYLAGLSQISIVVGLWVSVTYDLAAVLHAYVIYIGLILFKCRWMSITGCSFLYLSLTSVNRAFSCRRLKLQ